MDCWFRIHHTLRCDASSRSEERRLRPSQAHYSIVLALECELLCHDINHMQHCATHNEHRGEHEGTHLGELFIATEGLCCANPRGVIPPCRVNRLVNQQNYLRLFD